MERSVGQGLEIAAQKDGDKYHNGIEDGNPPAFELSDQTNHQLVTKRRGWSRVTVLLIATAIICLAVALGAGLGLGLKARNKPSPSGPHPSDPSPTTNSPVTITKSISVATATSSPTCPSTNGSTYTATNKPPVTDNSQLSAATITFEILCNTNVAEGGDVMDMQIINNVTSLNDCMDACALFDFQMKEEHFPAYACTGVSWGHGQNLNPQNTCWLKSNVTLGSQNDIAVFPGYDAAVLVGV